MTPEERELKRALEARSGEVTPQFRARLSSALSGEGRPSSNFLPALAAVAAVVLVFATVGVLLLARQSRNEPTPIAANTPSSSPVSTPSPEASPTPMTERGVLNKPPSPIALPASAQLSAPSSDVVWAFVVNEYLYRSMNGGVTWEQRPMPAPRHGGVRWLEISFVSSEEGWLTMSGAGPGPNLFAYWILHTTDAGATWQLWATKGIAVSQATNGLSFMDSRRGFLVTSDPNHPAVIYRTTDGGHTWMASQPLPYPPSFKTVCVVCGLRDAGSVRAFGSTLLVPAWQASDPLTQYVFRSVDGGATWTYAASSPRQGGNVDFVTATLWLELIGPGQSTETTDAGASWHRYASDYSQAAPIAADFVFADSSVGYGTVRGGITRTEDGGLHWTTIETPGAGMKACC